jgi:hypothetical protein
LETDETIGLDSTARPAALAAATMALPSHHLHQPLDGLAIDHDALHAKPVPNHAVAEVRLFVDEVLDPLRSVLVDHRYAIYPNQVVSS